MKWVVKEFQGKGYITYLVKNFEGIGHGDIGHVSRDLVLLAESLEIFP
jgi:hypothetical protein